MADVPQIVRARMAAQPAVSPHLDGDVLAAFAEQRLAKAERKSAMAHLALCAECREVLALASAAAPDDVIAAAEATAAGERGAARRFTLWRLALVGSLAVLAVSATLLLRLERPQTFEAHVSPPAAPLPAPSDTVTTPAPQPEAAQRTAQPLRAESRTEARRRPLPAPDAAAGFISAQPTIANAPASASRSDAEAKAKPASPAAVGGALTNGNATLAMASPPPPGTAAGAESNAATHGNAVAARRAPTDRYSAWIEQQQAATKQQRSSSDDAASTTAETVQVGQLPAQSPQMKLADSYEGGGRPTAAAKIKGLEAQQWSITAEGKLQHAVSGRPEGAVWQPVTISEGVIFRVVNATGADVWAGGNAGALFHSVDNGEHWKRVTPAEGSRQLSGDITALSATGKLREIVRVYTSTHETWTSMDAGLTWHVASR